MNQSTPHRIVNLPRSKKELENSSRSRKGYHTYVSHFFSDFKLLSKEQQETVLVDRGIWDESDDLSVDSVMTPRTVKSYEILKAASFQWRDFPIGAKAAWNKRAAGLNLLPVDGTLNRIPHAYKLPSLNGNVIDSVRHDWCYIVGLFRNAVTRKPKSGESERRYKFGDEDVVLGNQVYRSFHLNFLIRLSLFGDDDLGRLKNWEIIKRTKRVAVVHIASYTRMCSIFKIAGLSAVSFPKENCLYTCSGKVSLLVKRSNLTMVGYVMRETKWALTVHCGCENDIVIRKPRYENGAYRYEHCTNHQKDIYIQEYWPIRLKISISGATSFTMN